MPCRNKRIKYIDPPVKDSCSPTACYNLSKWSNSYVSMRKLILLCDCRPGGTIFENMKNAIEYLTENSNLRLVMTFAHPSLNVLRNMLEQNKSIILDYRYYDAKKDEKIYHSILIIPGSNRGHKGCYVVSSHRDTEPIKCFYNYRKLGYLLRDKHGSNLNTIAPLAWIFEKI